MKLGRVVIPVLATVVVVALGIITVVLASRGAVASEPASDPDPTPTSEPVAVSSPVPTPAPRATSEPVVVSNPAPTPAPKATPEPATSPNQITFELPVIPKKTLVEEQPTERSSSSGGTRSEPPPQPQGETYTWEDGDRTLTVLLQEDLVVQKTSEVMAADVVVVKGAVDSIVERQPTHGADSGPVFKSESGGGLMTLPGGVLLALDPNWDETQVEDFFNQNGISSDQVSELGFIPNGFLVETESGFPSLDLANELAAQDGVEISSPNWSREVEAK